jgi:mannose-6-phosphate isomerase-like protein (cupin superfamily)
MQHVIPVDFSKFPRGWHSEFLASPKTGIDSCYVICSRVEPGARGPNLHTHPADQFYYVLSGTLHVQLGTDEFEVGADTLIFIPEGTPHCNWNRGSQTEVHLEVIVPAPPMESIASPATPRTIAGAADLIRTVKRDAFKGDGFAFQVLANRAMGSQHAALHVAEVQANASGPSFHIHPFDQFYYVIDGRLNVEVGLRKYQAEANSLVILPAGVVHQNHNAGPGVEKHITILVPQPAPGELLDIPVQLQHDKAFGRLEPSSEEAP